MNQFSKYFSFLCAASAIAGHAAAHYEENVKIERTSLEKNVFVDIDKTFPNILKVKDFGAIPDDGKDDTAAIANAIKAAASKEGSRLVLNKGIYDVGMAGTGDYFRISDAKNLLIDGGGAKFLLHRVGCLFTIADCQNVRLGDFEVDMKNTPFLGGVVSATGDGWFEMKAVPPHKVGNDLDARVLLGYDRLLGCFDGVQYQKTFPDGTKAEKVADDTLRIPCHGNPPMLGKALVLRHQVYGGGVCRAMDSRNVLFKNIRVYGCAGMGLRGSACENIAIDGFKVKPAEGFWMSLTADASHFNCTRGTVEIFNSDFESMGDDATNIHSMYWLVEKSDGKLLTLSFAKDPARPAPLHSAPKAGDTLEIPSPNNYMRPETYAKIANVTQSADKRRLIVEIEGDLSAQLTVGMPLSVKEYRPLVRINNCTVSNVRPRGFLIQTTDALVENCFFKNTMAMAILIEADMDYWGESAASDKITISHCTFEDVNPWKRNGQVAVVASARYKKGLPFAGNIHGKIIVKNCTFVRCGPEPILLQYVETPITANNEVTQ